MASEEGVACMFHDFCPRSLQGVVLSCLLLLPSAEPLNGMMTLGALRSCVPCKW
jgi:hypothetical protein